MVCGDATQSELIKTNERNGIISFMEILRNMSSVDIIDIGSVFTVEPGIYIPGWGGVRIEDMVLLEESGPMVLTKTPK